MGVTLAVEVGSGVRDGVKVSVGGTVLVGVMLGSGVFVSTEGGMNVKVGETAKVGVKVVKALVGTWDGVLVSGENPVGSADPTIGTEIKNERALEETISIGSMGPAVMIGS